MYKVGYNNETDQVLLPEAVFANKIPGRGDVLVLRFVCQFSSSLKSIFYLNLLCHRYLKFSKFHRIIICIQSTHSPQGEGQALVLLQPGVKPDVQPQVDRYDLGGIHDWSSETCDCFQNCGLCMFTHSTLFVTLSN